ncbi:MAG: acyl carrier protein [Clostridiales bacterium]|nr:acyl carrier protein [Clostridiales bacterium]
MSYEEKIKSFLGRYVNVDDLKNDDNIFEIGLVDSLFAVQLVSYIEEEFDIAITNQQLDLDNFKDINSIAAIIRVNLAV